jgi:hypothetical protein
MSVKQSLRFHFHLRKLSFLNRTPHLKQKYTRSQQNNLLRLKLSQELSFLTGTILSFRTVEDRLAPESTQPVNFTDLKVFLLATFNLSLALDFIEWNLSPLSLIDYYCIL